MGLLAAADEIAETIASKNDRLQPSDNDFVAALSALCLFPPNNKPPFVEEYWPNAIAAFYSGSVRDSLQQAVGPTAVELSDTLQDNNISPLQHFNYPDREEDYLEQMLHLRILPMQ